MSLFKTNVAPAEAFFGCKQKEVKIKELQAEIKELKADIKAKTEDFHAKNKALGFAFDNKRKEIKKEKDTLIKEYMEIIAKTKKD